MAMPVCLPTCRTCVWLFSGAESAWVCTIWCVAFNMYDIFDIAPTMRLWRCSAFGSALSRQCGSLRVCVCVDADNENMQMKFHIIENCVHTQTLAHRTHTWQLTHSTQWYNSRIVRTAWTTTPSSLTSDRMRSQSICTLYYSAPFVVDFMCVILPYFHTSYIIDDIIIR